MTKVIILHGNGNSSPQDNWIPYCKQEFEKLGIECLTPQFPDAPICRKEYWMPFLEEMGADENTILIGHSTGAVAALRYAEDHKILGSVLIGTYYTHLDNPSEQASGYFDTPWNWKDIQNNQQWTVIFASCDDPWIPIQEPRFIQQQLDSDYYEYLDKGHFGGDYEKLEFPELVLAVQKKLKNESYLI